VATIRTVRGAMGRHEPLLVSYIFLLVGITLRHGSATAGLESHECPARQPGQSLTAAAAPLYNAGRLQEALACLEQAAAERPTPRAHSNVASTLQALGRLTEAGAAVERALAALSSDDVAVLWTAATVTYMRRQYPAALALCDRVLALEPLNAKVGAAATDCRVSW